MSKTKTENRPTHIIWQVIGEGDAAIWKPIGAAWPNRDGKGYALKFDAFPVSGHTVLRKVKDQTSGQKEGTEASGHVRNAS